MYLSEEEMKSVLYDYQMESIADCDSDIITDAIDSAIEEVRGYLLASNQRRETASLNKQQYAAWRLYDVDAVFEAEGAERNAFILRLVKRVAAWNIVELAAPDVLYERVRDRYERAINTLEKIAGMGDYVNDRLVISGLPLIDEDDNADNNNTAQPFRMISRPKFHHEEYC